MQLPMIATGSRRDCASNAVPDQSVVQAARARFGGDEATLGTAVEDGSTGVRLADIDAPGDHGGAFLYSFPVAIWGFIPASAVRPAGIATVRRPSASRPTDPRPSEAVP